MSRSSLDIVNKEKLLEEILTICFPDIAPDIAPDSAPPPPDGVLSFIQWQVVKLVRHCQYKYHHGLITLSYLEDLQNNISELLQQVNSENCAKPIHNNETRSLFTGNCLLADNNII